MRIDAISLGKDPPDEVNVIIEVPIGGEPIKYEMDKAQARCSSIGFSTCDALSRKLRLHSAHAFGRW